MRIWPTKRWWKRTGIGLAIVVALALIANGVMAWWTEHRLQTQIAAIRAAGDPASIADLAPEPIPDDENAAAILKRLEPRLEEFGKEHGRFFNTPLGKAYDEAQQLGDPATAEQIEAIQNILSKYPDVEQAIVQAAQCKRFASGLDFSLKHREFLEQLLDSVQHGRTAARFLGWRGEVLLAEGRYEDAINNAIQALQLARLHEHEPTMVAHMVAMAMRSKAIDQLYDALAVTNISPELHEKLDEELALHDNPQRVIEVLKTERALNADWVDGEFGNLTGGKAMLAQMVGWPMKSYAVGTLNAMGEVIEMASQPAGNIRLQLRFTGAEKPKTEHGVLADLLVPALEAFFRAHARHAAVSRSLRIFNALTQFRDEHGREASGLEELALPKEATIDPFSGKPLKLKHTDEGWVVYSVMANGVDDGGDFKEQKDYGVAPAKWRSTN